MQIQIESVDFRLFFMIWAMQSDWDVPDFHWDMIDFLEKSDDWENGTGVLQVFRGAAKSTITALWIVFKLVKDPSLRFLILSADDRAAKRMSRDCRNIITRHPLASHLRGREEQWRENQFDVVGNDDARNPSVSAYGITSNITSARTDICVFDDVEVKRNTGNEEMREKIRLRINEVDHLLIPVTGRKLFIGTPHAFESIYPERIEMGATSLFLPLIMNPEGEWPEMQGESRWADRFTEDVIKLRQLQSTKGEFLSQYQLIPVSVEDSILEPDKCLIYEQEVLYYRSHGRLYANIGGIRDAHGTILGGQDVVSVSAFWDPSLSKAKGDSSVLAIVYSTDRGHYFIHRLFTITGDADQQCKQVRKHLVEFKVPAVGIETNGIGGFLPQILLKQTRGTGIGVDEVFTSLVSKGVSIVEAFETPLSISAIHISKQVSETPFLQQMRDFHPRNTRVKDDYIDAASKAIEREPIRMGRGKPVSGRVVDQWGEYSDAAPVEPAYSSVN